MGFSSFVKYARQFAGIAQEAKRAQAVPTDVCNLVIFVEEGTPSELVSWVRDAFVPENNSATVFVERFGAGSDARIHAHTHLALVLVGKGGAEAEELVVRIAHDGVPCAVLAQSSVEAPDIAARIPTDAQCALITATSEAALVDKLSDWLVSAVETPAGLVRAFPFVRDAKAEQLIGECALENALIGALGAGSAAQMPLMTANQARMAFELSSIFGLNDLKMQAPAIAGVVGAGFLWRTLARVVSSKVPGLEPVARVAIAFAGTLASGHALKGGISYTQKSQEEESTAIQPAV